MSSDDIKILIVEDHFITRMGLRIVLEDRPGLTVIDEAEDGNEALQKTISLTPDVVLLDIGLPKIDGIECLKRIKAAGNRSRIMMRSSHEEYAAILAAFAAGADGYCLKDASDDLLAEGVRCLAQGHAWLDPRVARHLALHFSEKTNLRHRSTQFKDACKSVLLNDEIELLKTIAEQPTDIFTQKVKAQDGEPDQLRALMQKIGQLSITVAQ